MTTNISILPESLCNQIAAGEVVERPSSVVKELVENALDANATEVHIELDGGGRKLIRVADNGNGMDKEDVFLCLERHATSKISTGADLFRLTTLGFRGEALPSIAAVSRLTLRSRSAATLEGWEIYAEGGTVRRAGVVGMPLGTTVEVRDLFFNTPARRKFLRKEETEFAHVAELLTRLALSMPEVQFRLLHNQRIIFDIPRHQRLLERVAALLGRPLLASLAPVAAESIDGLNLNGFISQPELHRATTGGIYAYINGRYIRDRVVQHAILDGVRHLFPKGRFPVAILFLSIPADQVDVNVHPTKHEVRFSRQREVHDFIAMSVRNSLRSSLTSSSPPVSDDGTDRVMHSERDEVHRNTPLISNDQPQQHTLLAIRESSPIYRQSVELQSAESSSLVSAGPTGFFASLRIIGQYRNTYILGEDPDGGLILVDQHAAHERIGFEKLREQYTSGSLVRQSLLFPVVFDCDFREAALLVEHADILLTLGFELEPFGGRSFAIKTIPALFAGTTDPVRLLRDVAAELVETGVSKQIEIHCEKILVTMACHAMVRANLRLTLAEIQGLFRDLDRIDFNRCCPHGRPVQVRLTEMEIAKMFRRNA